LAAGNDLGPAFREWLIDRDRLWVDHFLDMFLMLHQSADVHFAEYENRDETGTHLLSWFNSSPFSHPRSTGPLTIPIIA
jgi:hypothetical protein